MDRLLNSLNETIDTIADLRLELKFPNWSILGGGLVSLVRDRLKTQRRPKRDGLPLLLQSPWHPSITRAQTAEVERVIEALRDLSADFLTFLHHVCDHLKFWRERNEASDRDKVKFMLLERGPWAFAVGVTRFLQASFREESVTKGTSLFISTRISSRVAVLTDVQCRLATLLGVVSAQKNRKDEWYSLISWKSQHCFLTVLFVIVKVHMEIDKLGSELTKSSDIRSAMTSSLVAVFRAMSNLEGLYDLPQAGDLFTELLRIQSLYALLLFLFASFNGFDNSRTTSSVSLQFDELPQELLSKEEWIDKDVELAIEILSHNVEALRFTVDYLMVHYRKPSKLTRKWIRCTATATVIALASGWVIRHSRLMGSDDLDRWLRDGNAAFVSFTKEHVEELLVAMRDELFDTFRKRHSKADVVGEAQLTAESLNKMLLDYVNQTSGNASKDLTQEDMMKVLMTRYEDEVVYPLRNVFFGQLARALLIQIQKLKLDTEMQMVELKQILRANEINFAILAAFPAVLLTFFVGLMIQRVLSKVDKKIGRGREAQARRRMLMAEVEKAILCFQMMIDADQEDEAAWRFGMVIYTLDQLYRSVEQAARSTHEWSSVRGDIMDLATPRLATSYKLAITARMERIYECLVPLANFK